MPSLLRRHRAGAAPTWQLVAIALATLQPSLVGAADTDCTEPVPISTVAPEYPPAALESGEPGSVTVDVLVAPDGTVLDLSIVSSSNAVFEAAVIAVLGRWQFTAGTCDGEPVRSRKLQRVNFVPDARHEAYTIDVPKTGEWPEELRYDEPPIVTFDPAPVFPRDRLQDNVITGSATVSALIGPDGRVRESRILKASHPSFGLAARAMMEQWTFEPAKKNRQPSWALVSREVQFDSQTEHGYVPEDIRRMALRPDGLESLPRVTQLDRKPQPLFQASPVFPDTLRDAGVADTVIVEFVIDQDGSVRLPTPIRYRNEQLAWAATSAVARWRYERPTLEGRPVNARAAVPVLFEIPGARVPPAADASWHGESPAVSMTHERESGESRPRPGS